MQITFVMPVLEVSGGAHIIVGHAERLAARGHKVSFIAPRPRPLTVKQRIKKFIGHETTITSRSDATIARSIVPLVLPKHFHEIVEDDVPDADVIIASWWETGNWIKDFKRNKGVKVHFIQHYEGFSPMPADRVDEVWRLPTFKIVIAKWLVDLAATRFGLRNVALVPNAVDDVFRINAKRIKNNTPAVGFLYHTADFKDFATTRAAVEHLRHLRPDLRLLSFGATRPSRGDLPDGTEFHYLPPREVIAKIYEDCDVWLSTSVTEGFNLPPLEAMAVGTPTVCGKTGRPLEVIKDGLNGFLVEPKDVGGFASALDNVLSLSLEEWQKMSNAAREAVAFPTWAQSTQLFEEALEVAVGADN